MTAAQGNLDVLLRRLLPLWLLIFAIGAGRACLEGAPGVGDIAHLKAIALPFGRLLGWIAGAHESGLVPAPSRTAPLPLILDWLLWRAVPFGIMGLRFAHVLLAIGALWMLLQGLAMRMDSRTAALAGAVIALSPRFIEAVTNLGTDPFVFILFCWQLAILLTRGKIGGPEPLLIFTAAGAASGMCGVAGMIAATSLFAALLVAAPDRGEALRRAGMTLLVIPVWASPLFGQIMQGAPADGLSSRGLISLGTKLAAHNADLLLLPGALLLLAGTAMLILLGLYCYVGRLRRNGPSERTHPFVLLLVATATGAILVPLAGPVLQLYPWTEPSAQAWLSLLIMLLAAACFTPRLVPSTEGPRRLRRVAAALMIAGAVSGTISYHYRSEWFASGPEAGLARALEGAGRSRAIVYAGADWGRTFFPHMWLNPKDGDQWLLTLDGQQVQRIEPNGRLQPLQPLSALDSYDILILTRIDRRGWRDLSAVTNTQVIGAMPPASLEAFPQYWQAEPAQAAPGEYWLTTQLLRRQNSL